MAQLSSNVSKYGNLTVMVLEEDDERKCWALTGSVSTWDGTVCVNIYIGSMLQNSTGMVDTIRMHYLGVFCCPFSMCMHGDDGKR